MDDRTAERFERALDSITDRVARVETPWRGYLSNDGSDATMLDVTVEVVPEPAMLALLALGSLVALRRRRR